MLTRYKHIKTAKKRLKDGSVRLYYYHRKTGKKIHGVPGSPEFAASYAQASVFDRAGIVPGTIHELVVNFLSSTSYAELSERTRADYRKHSDTVLDRFGTTPVAVFEDPRIVSDIEEWRDNLSKNSLRQADYALAFLSRMLSFSKQRGRLSVNHAIGLPQLYKADRSTLIWEDDDIEAFLRHAWPEMALALRLALDTAQRQGDLIKLSWTQYDGNGIMLRQGKTNKLLRVPCTELLRQELNRMPRRATTILTGRRGRPWTSDGFRTEWRKVAVAAGIQGRLTFHDLRGSAVTRLAEAGCEIPEIASISGHSVKQVSKILETYMARTDRMAANAIVKLENFRKKNRSGT